MKVNVNLDVLSTDDIIYLVRLGAVDDTGLEDLTSDVRWQVRFAVAKTAKRDTTLWTLAGDDDPEVRGGVMCNPHASSETKERAYKMDVEQEIIR